MSEASLISQPTHSQYLPMEMGRATEEGGTPTLISHVTTSVFDNQLHMKATPHMNPFGTDKLQSLKLSKKGPDGNTTEHDGSVAANPRSLAADAYTYAPTSSGQDIVVRIPGVCALSYPVPEGTDTSVDARTVFETTMLGAPKLRLESPHGPATVHTVAARAWGNFRSLLAHQQGQGPAVDPQRSEEELRWHRIMLHRPERATEQQLKTCLASDLNELKWPQCSHCTNRPDYASSRASLPYASTGAQMLRAAQYAGDVSYSLQPSAKLVNDMGESFQKSLEPLRTGLSETSGTQEASEARERRLDQIASSLYQHVQKAFDPTKGSSKEQARMTGLQDQTFQMYRKVVRDAEHDLLTPDGSVRDLKNLYAKCLGPSLLETSENPDGDHLQRARLPDRLVRESWSVPSVMDRLRSLGEKATSTARIMY